MEGLRVREELRGPVDGAPETTGCAVAEGGGVCGVGGLEGLGGEVLGVCPGAF